MTEILPGTAAGVARAAALLAAGEVVGMPTETVYGLAGVATDERAVAAIFAAKERPTFDPLIVHLGERGWLEQVADLSALAAEDQFAAEALAQAFWPGPLTLVLPRRPEIPDLVTSGLATVAVRMPAHPLARALLAAVGHPLAAPSANRFGRISPTSAADVVAELGGRIPAVLDGGRCAVGVESTIVSLDAGATLLRPGGVPAAEIERVLGRPLPHAKANHNGPLPAPGMLPSHYAPRTPLVLLPGPVTQGPLPDGLPHHVGLLVQAGDARAAAAAFTAATQRQVTCESLSEAGDLGERARHLFAALRRLDASGAELLLVEDCAEDEGLGHAIRDRLRRAATPKAS